MPLRLISGLTITGNRVELSGEVGLIRRLFANERFQLKLSGKFSNAAVKIDGAIDDVLDLQGIGLDGPLTSARTLRHSGVSWGLSCRRRARDVTGT